MVEHYGSSPAIEDPPLIAKILGHVRSHEAVTAIQARAPPAEERTALKLT